MNEKVRNFVLTVVICLFIGSAGTFFLCQRSSSARIEQYRTAESAIIEDNIRLRKQLSDIEDRLRQYQSFNDSARRILTSQKSSIDKLRALIESLPD